MLILLSPAKDLAIETPVVKDATQPVLLDRAIPLVEKLKTLPAMLCPKGLSRLTLEVKAVRVERLQEISENDCEAEGIERLTGNGPNFASYLVPGLGHFNFPTMVGAYRELWDGINAKRGHSWETNPWVWVVEFERAEEAR